MSEDTEASDSDIAIVGMGVRVPGALTVGKFWQNLRDGVEAVRFLSDEELRDAGVPGHVFSDPDYVKAGCFLEAMDEFDAGFFGFSPKEAAIMDPQHRQFLECSWEALEHAGFAPKKFDGPIGIFAGCGMGTYMMYNVMANRELVDSVGYFLLRHTGNDKDFLCTRVSYSFDLTGPSINVQTACSTSLVAVHLACHSLLTGECDLALAGGVTLEIPHLSGYKYVEGEILSPDGHCRAFDHRSRGTIFGSGAGVVVLRRLADALEDGDTIHAVIRGTAVNNDGAMKAGFLAPSVEGQAAAISEALAVANVDARSISYVEAHGTGTPIGDPIEISALTQAFRQSTEDTAFCRIGSVKTNIGHLDTAAGVVSLIKAALSLNHAELPPSLNFESPNREIGFESTPFVVNDRLCEWPRDGGPRRAAVNSLGVGGTNAHAILEEPPPPAQPTAKAPDVSVLRISARSRRALDESAKRLARHLSEYPDLDLADVAHTLTVGRTDLPFRRVLACGSCEDAALQLEANDTRRVFTHRVPQRTPSPVFLYPGGGAQYLGMASGLYSTKPVFKEALKECIDLSRDKYGVDLQPLLFAAGTNAALEAEFERPSRQLPAIFALEYAFTRLWQAQGVEPVALLGHSLGENTAACIAGVFSLEDAMGLVCLRGELFERLAEGGMLSVALQANEVEPLLGDELDLGVVNAPDLVVVSGPTEPLESLAGELARREVETQRIRIRTAAHSRMLEPVLGEFRQYLKGIRLGPPEIPVVSNRTGTWLTDAQATDPGYWVEHLRHQVRFRACAETLFAKYKSLLLLEVGPGATLSSLVRAQTGFGPEHNVVNSLRHRDLELDDATFFDLARARLWASGLPLTDEPSPGRRIPLPTYPFEHRRYWVEPTTTNAADEARVPSFLTREPNPEDWYYQTVWEPAPLGPGQMETGNVWLVFLDDAGVGTQIVERLVGRGDRVVTVQSGGINARRAKDSYVLDSDRGMEGYETLVAGLATDGLLPNRVLHLWTLTASDDSEGHLNLFAYNLERSFYCCFFLMRALTERDALKDTHFIVISNGKEQVFDEAVSAPEKATLEGPCRVALREQPGLTYLSVDVDFDQKLPPWAMFTPGRRETTSLRALVAEVTARPKNGTIAYRRGIRYAKRYERAPLSAEEPKTRGQKLREGGNYLITGGLGGIGLVIAEAMAKVIPLHLSLLSRRGLPPRERWDSILEKPTTRESTRRTIEAIRRMERAGAQVSVGAVDVTDHEELQSYLRDVEAEYGPVRGVVHAAGTLHDNLLAVKTVDEVENVFAPKVYGTQVLDMLFRGKRLDFFVVFSSSSTVTAPAGQTDYVAANAYLNAFARHRARREKERVIALNWGVWSEVGMAARAAASPGSESVALSHPLFRERKDSQLGHELSLPLSAETHWLIDEHRLADGRALLPGTAYLQIASAAHESIQGSQTCEIRDLTMLLPLEVSEGETEVARVKILPAAEGLVLEVQSHRISSEGTRGWLTHARCEVGECGASRPVLETGAIERRCGREVRRSNGQALRTCQERHLRFGPRWHVLTELRFGDGEALATLSLAEPLASDLVGFPLHPAMLDIATGSAMELLEGYDPETAPLWVPAAYGRVRVYSGLSRTVRSWIRVRDAEPGRASFDVTICDAQGRVSVEIEMFSVQSLRQQGWSPLRDVPATLLENDQARAESNGPPSHIERAFRNNVQQGIRPEQGAAAFLDVIDLAPAGEVFVSSLDLDALEKQASLVPRAAQIERTSFERPTLAVDYVAPRSDDERTLVEFWQGLLGLKTVGVRDDFFELGGHSLIAVRLMAKIKNTWGVSLPVSVLFEAPTVEALAARLPQQVDGPQSVRSVRSSNGSSPSAWSSLVPIRKSGHRRPFYCVAGKGGNPMNLRHLAARLPKDQPFYGIQFRGVDGVLEPHETVEDMARDSIADIQRIQPSGPYLLGGFSGGGLVVLEMAHQLLKMGERLGLIALLDTPSPGRLNIDRSQRLRLHLLGLRRQGPAYAFRKGWSRIRNTLRPEQPEPLVEVHGENGEPEAPTNMAQAWESMESRYRPRPYPGRAVLFRPYLDLPHSADPFMAGDEFNGWREYFTEGVQVIELPGGHTTMCEEPHVRVFAKRLMLVLAQSNDARSNLVSEGASARPNTSARATQERTIEEKAAP